MPQDGGGPTAARKGASRHPEALESPFRKVVGFRDLAVKTVG